MKLMVLDGNSVINRAYYGVRALTTKDGFFTNAIYGFLNILEKLRAEEQPDALCVAFDLKAHSAICNTTDTRLRAIPCLMNLLCRCLS